MDRLKRIRDEEAKLSLLREFGKQLHVVYDRAATHELPLQLEKLTRRLEERLH